MVACYWTDHFQFYCYLVGAFLFVILLLFISSWDESSFTAHSFFAVVTRCAIRKPHIFLMIT